MGTKTLAVIALLVAVAAGYFSYVSYQKIDALKPASIARTILSMQAEQQLLSSLKGKSRAEQEKAIQNFFDKNKVSTISLSSAAANNSACDIYLERSQLWAGTSLGSDYLALYQTNCSQ